MGHPFFEVGEPEVSFTEPLADIALTDCWSSIVSKTDTPLAPPLPERKRDGMTVEPAEGVSGPDATGVARREIVAGRGGCLRIRDSEENYE